MYYELILFFPHSPKFCFVIIVSSEEPSFPCLLRLLEGGNSVCVCNSSYCDKVPALGKLAPGIVAVYTSSQAGDRLNYTTIKTTTNGSTPERMFFFFMLFPTVLNIKRICLNILTLYAKGEIYMQLF